MRHPSRNSSGLTPAIRKAVIAALGIVVGPAYGQGDSINDLNPLETSIRFSFGYKLIDVGPHSYSHDTHPDDSFLPNASVPGSAGTTSIGGEFHMAALGVRLIQPLDESWRLDLEAGGLFTYQLERAKNANDSRPDASAAFVYSEAYFGAYVSAGVAYQLGRFSLGATAQLAAVDVMNGWDRFDHLQVDYHSTQFAWSVGPTIGFRLDQRLSVESTVAIGDRVTASLMVVWGY